MSSASADEWQPDPGDLAGLSPRGLVRVELVTRRFSLTRIEGALLLDYGRAISRIERLESAIAVEGIMVDGAPSTALVALAREQRVAIALWGLLRIENEAVP